MATTFIQRAIALHENKYDYSLINCKTLHDKIKIICPTHGEFEQRADSHLQGSGCKKCMSDRFRKGKEQFIIDAQKIHRNKYDYSIVEYKKANVKVKIICSTHGEFEQTPNDHLSGKGCSKCGKLQVADLQRKTSEKFIEEAVQVHGDKYDYSLVNYINNHTNVTIICPTHGNIEQNPNTHLRGHGCSKCFGNTKGNTNKFIEDSYTIHGDKYDYSLVKYINNSTSVTIICKLHGQFKQNPHNHLEGKGCSQCVNKTEGLIKQFLIDNNIPFETQCEVDGKKFDFLVNNDFILEIDGYQHFPNYLKHAIIPKEGREINLQNDLNKMKSIIDYYPIVRLFQEHIWKNTYNWKNLLSNIKNLEPGFLYIRTSEKELYNNHISDFDIKYLNL